jgi:hypothetical protein
MSKKGFVDDPEFAALLQKSQKTQSKSKKSQKNQPAQRPFFFAGVTDLTGGPSINLNAKCGCFGTRHDVINNCLGCGRVICTAEGERPCPFCGELVLSNETLDNPEQFERVVSELRAKIGRERWVPMREEARALAEISQDISTAMIDADRDYFDAALLGVSSGALDDSW